MWTNYVNLWKHEKCCWVNTCLLVLLSVFFSNVRTKRLLEEKSLTFTKHLKPIICIFLMWISQRQLAVLWSEWPWLRVKGDLLSRPLVVCWLALLLITVNNQHVAAFGSPGVGRNIFIWPCWRSRNRCHWSIHHRWPVQHHTEAFNIALWLYSKEHLKVNKKEKWMCSNHNISETLWS